MGGKRNNSKSKPTEEKTETIFETQANELQTSWQKIDKNMFLCMHSHRGFIQSFQSKNQQMHVPKKGNTNADEMNLPPPVPKQTKIDP